MSISLQTQCTLAVFASGNGSNFQALIDACATGRIPASIAVLITDNAQAKAIERAKSATIPFEVVEHGRNRDENGTRILQALAPYKVQLVCLAGYMRILASNVIQQYTDSIVNIHPSLLPKFPGLHAVRQALIAGEHETGCTVHFVDEGVDTGPIITQQSLPIEPAETEEHLHQRIHALEHELYPRALQQILRERGYRSC